MTTTISHLKRVSYNDGNLILYYSKFITIQENDLSYETEETKESSGFPLTTGVELSVYKQGGILKADISSSDGTNFGNYSVLSEILFENVDDDDDSDITGGFIKIDINNGISDTIRLQGDGNNYDDLVVGVKDLFHLSIIGVDDIRASVRNPLNYIETYLMEEQKIFLKVTPKEVSPETFKKYLQVRYAKRL